MASTIFRGSSVLLLYIALSFHPMTLAQAQIGTEVDPLIAAMQNAVLSPIPIESSAAQVAPAETNTEDPLGTSSTSPQDPTVQLEPLTDDTNSLRTPMDILNSQVQGEQPPTEDKPAAFPCDGAPAAPSMEHVVPMDAILPAPGGKGTNAKPPYLNFTDMEIFPDLTEIEPSSLAQVQPPSATNSSNAKPAVCGNNPTLNLYASGTSLASTCRAYLYTNSRRTSWSRCTAWFASPTHAVLAGHCIANGGSGRYFPSLVNGRYGTVCCRTRSNTGPDNCEAGYGFDILTFSAASGWLYNNRASNDGAVLKLRRPANVANGVGVALRYGQPNPFCPTAALQFAGYPGQTTSFSGCNQAWSERFAFSTTSGARQCTMNVGFPSLAFRGSSCGGMSGGPIGIVSTNVQIGILSQGDVYCSSARSNTYFTAISNGGTSWGVNVANLISQVP
eukprot:jgi/Botrbrau1/19915/Bobra.0059s0032.1